MIDTVVEARCRDEGRMLVTIAGCSQAGKTTGSFALKRALAESGHTASVVALDDFFFPTNSLSSRELAGWFDRPAAMDFELLGQLLSAWERGIEVAGPVLLYSTEPGGLPATTRSWFGQKTWQETLIIEGIFAHYREVSRHAAISVFVNGVPEALRLERRIRRDIAERGFLEAQVRELWARFIEPGCRNCVVPDVLGDRCRVDYWVNGMSALPEEGYVGKPIDPAEGDGGARSAGPRGGAAPNARP